MGLVTPDFGLVFWMLVSFTIVMVILKKFAWKPILESLKQREETIQSALDAAVEAKQEMKRLQADNQEIMRQAEQQRDKMLAEAREVKDKIVAEAKEQATFEAQKIIQAAKSAIESEKAMAVNLMKKQISEFSVDIAKRILTSELSDHAKQKQMAENLIDEVKFN